MKQWLGPVAQGCVQPSCEYLQGSKCRNDPGPLGNILPPLSYLFSSKYLLRITQVEFCVPGPLSQHLCEESDSLLLHSCCNERVVFSFLKCSVALSKMLLRSRALSMFDLSMKAIAHYYGMFYVVQILSLEYIPTAEQINLCCSGCLLKETALSTDKSNKWHFLNVLNYILWHILIVLDSFKWNQKFPQRESWM